MSRGALGLPLLPFVEQVPLALLPWNALTRSIETLLLDISSRNQ
jgi:hypothetical protein